MHSQVLRPLTYLALCLAAQLVLYGSWQSRAFWSTLLPKFKSTNATYIDRFSETPGWFAPCQSSINNLSSVLEGTGVFGFVFDSSETPKSIPYGTYNWCNMPHVRRKEYPFPSKEFKLEYVEVIHRHHKRTPYASNTFPAEVEEWNCDDQRLFYYGAPEPEGKVAVIGWQVYTSTVNPLAPTGFKGTCQFPQITSGGLLDSRRHGEDIFGVYHDLLHFLPNQLDTSKMTFRVTNNQITSQVAGQVILGMYPDANQKATEVLVQSSSIDSLEPSYPCPAASKLHASMDVGSTHPRWTRHLKDKQTMDLFARLDSISGIDRSDSDWHDWFDHYFDNLSSRLCHQKPLPCSAHNSSLCVTREEADAVFRRGEYEYSFIYRDTPELFEASVASYGIWIAELAANMRSMIDGKSGIIYRHNFAHDGSISRLLSILQIKMMVWPGMGSEVVFELYSKDDQWYLRVLWNGQVFTSSHPSLGRLDMLPVEAFLKYVDELVGIGAVKVPLSCSIN